MIRGPECPIRVLLVVVKRPGLVRVFLNNFVTKPRMSAIHSTTSLAGNPECVVYCINSQSVYHTASTNPAYTIDDLTRLYPTPKQVRLQT